LKKTRFQIASAGEEDMRIILASASPRRKKLLEDEGIEFEVMPSSADESLVNDNDPAKLVQRLAELKASGIAEKSDDAIIIGADTVVFLDGILGKPKDMAHARQMLSMLSSREHSVFTGVCVINSRTKEKRTDYAETRVKFKHLAHDEIKRLAGPDSLGYAGAYAIQHQPFLIEKVTGSYTNVVGLPMEKLREMLKGLDSTRSKPAHPKPCLQ